MSHREDKESSSLPRLPPRLCSNQLLLRRSTGWKQDFFDIESYRVISDHNGAATTEATVKLRVGGERVVATAEGNGPVNALDGAVRQAIGSNFPALDHIHHFVGGRVVRFAREAARARSARGTLSCWRCRPVRAGRCG